MSPSQRLGPLRSCRICICYPRAWRARICSWQPPCESHTRAKQSAGLRLGRQGEEKQGGSNRRVRSLTWALAADNLQELPTARAGRPQSAMQSKHADQSTRRSKQAVRGLRCACHRPDDDGARPVRPRCAPPPGACVLPCMHAGVVHGRPSVRRGAVLSGRSRCGGWSQRGR
jgi:hypothetical protein